MKAGSPKYAACLQHAARSQRAGGSAAVMGCRTAWVMSMMKYSRDLREHWIVVVQNVVRWLIAVCAVLATTPSLAQGAYPSRPIRLVVPYPPGALTDILARAIGERLAAGLGQPVVIDNKPGAGTLVGAEFVAKQPPD